MKVAVVGLAESSLSEVPWGSEWELWGLAWDVDRYRFHRAFEMHDMRTMTTCGASIYKDLPDYFERISLCRRLYMADSYQEVPGAERYPYEQVAQVCVWAAPNARKADAAAITSRFIRWMSCFWFLESSLSSVGQSAGIRRIHRRAKRNMMSAR